MPSEAVIIPAGVESVLNADVHDLKANAFGDFVLTNSRVASVRLGPAGGRCAAVASRTRASFSLRCQKASATCTVECGCIPQCSAVAGNSWPQNNAYPLGDFDGDGHHDAMILRNDGRMIMHSYRDRTRCVSIRQIGSGWNSRRDIHSDIDFNGDCRMGIVARDKRGDLWVYPGKWQGRFRRP